MTTLLDIKTDQLHQLCNKFSVKELYLIGSAASGKYTENSDLDFIVKFKRKGFDGVSIHLQELEQIYGRPVDLYHQKNFRNSIFQQEVDLTKSLLYAAYNKEIIGDD